MFEKTINIFHKCLEDKDRFISNLEEKFTEMERKYENVIEEQRTKIETLENANNENAKNTAILMKNLSSKETIQTPNNLKKFKCSKCDFETDHEQKASKFM